VKLISWNVNGLRAVYKKGFLKWLSSEKPDVLCIQETKATQDVLPESLINPAGYNSYFTSAEKKGYSGVAIYTLSRPIQFSEGMGEIKFDGEGRMQVADFGEFVLCNVYFPNGKASKERLKYKMDFYDAFLNFVIALKKKGREIVICGDVNTAHMERDLARPKQNEKSSGFLPEERAWIDRFLASGFLDTFRMFNSDDGQYSWWDYKTKARERNVGWRIDYFFASKGLESKIKSAVILSDVFGSDHCPVGMELDL